MLIVDRFEEDKAVVFDDEKRIILSRDLLSPFVKEGDVITLSDNGIYITDKEQTDRRRNDNVDLLQKLLNKRLRPCGIFTAGSFSLTACMDFRITAACTKP